MDYYLNMIPTISQQASSSAGPSAMPPALHIDASDIVISPGDNREGSTATVYMGLAKTPTSESHNFLVAVKESTKRNPAAGKERFETVRTAYYICPYKMRNMFMRIAAKQALSGISCPT